ncbi:hypothetical protein DDQ41_19720 [Streptomyces spongiicola]|uniref:Hydrolase n=1 Tax=Streptomyces spongiicola TaxID=1690221 RepID=A0ABN5KKM3_9ACTN|nr:hypothetical protein DDQ41_19720 [Streptomyces spongiicola]
MFVQVRVLSGRSDRWDTSREAPTGLGRTVQQVQLLALFDLDNTLSDRQGASEEWARAFSASRRLASDAERLTGGALRERAYPADFERLRASLSLGEAASCPIS